MKKINKKGAITVIFLVVVALALAPILTATQSRLLLSLTPTEECGLDNFCISKVYKYLCGTFADQNTYIAKINQNVVREPKMESCSVTIFIAVT